MTDKYDPPNKSIVKEFLEMNCSLYSVFIDEIVNSLKLIISNSDIEINSIESRIKEIDSLYKKVIQLELVNKFEKIDDIAGVRIICLYRNDLPKIGKLIEDNFLVVKKKLLSAQDEFVFGYISDHYIVKHPLSDDNALYGNINYLKCEIQIRTISMHAWDVVSHHLNYKKEIYIPQELKKDFSALSGIFYVADTLFDQFRNSREAVINQLKENINYNLNQIKAINYDSLDAYISWKFPDRNDRDDPIYPEQLSNLLDEINKCKFDSVKELDEIINNDINLILNEEKEYIKENKISVDKIYKGVGIIRKILKKMYPEIY